MNDDKYIPLVTALKDIREMYEQNFPTASGAFDEFAVVLVPQTLRNIEPADVRPATYGKWVWCKDHWECSRCRGARYHDLALGLDAAYCGHCGAEMKA